MKLRNKKTGEIGYFCFANWDSPVLIIMDKNGVQLAKYNSLAELNEEWEDYEEPKVYWYIDYDGEILCGGPDNSSTEKMMISMENHFETIEEAEKAVKKLKAWKRLKDKGFRFDGWTIDDGLRISICTNTDSEGIYDDDKKEMKKDLDLVFGVKNE